MPSALPSTTMFAPGRPFERKALHEQPAPILTVSAPGMLLRRVGSPSSAAHRPS
jgi:hypothetical protein